MKKLLAKIEDDLISLNRNYVRDPEREKYKKKNLLSNFSLINLYETEIRPYSCSVEV